jgi:PadR family transcriptional regulator, regulatory protein PadR
MVDAYLGRLERDMAAGALHLLLLGLIARMAPIHGYALIRALAESTDGLLQFKPGTIYPILNDLEKQGIVRSSWVSGETGPQRKAYELTATGREVLAGAAKSWARLRLGVDQTLTGGGKR